MVTSTPDAVETTGAPMPPKILPAPHVYASEDTERYLSCHQETAGAWLDCGWSSRAEVGLAANVGLAAVSLAWLPKASRVGRRGTSAP